MAYTGKPKIVGTAWVQALLGMESFTHQDAARVFLELTGMKRYGPDLIHKLRWSPELELEVLGAAGPPHHPRTKRFRLRLKEEQ